MFTVNKEKEISAYSDAFGAQGDKDAYFVDIDAYFVDMLTQGE